MIRKDPAPRRARNHRIAYSIQVFIASRGVKAHKRLGASTICKIESEMAAHEEG